jgi:hypothetical protein
LSIDKSFALLCSTFSDPKELYYFAYGGTVDEEKDIRVIDRVSMVAWMNNEGNVKLFKKLLGFA